MLKKFIAGAKKFFKNIEKEPEEKKMRIVWFWVILCMIGIFLLWITTACRNFANLSNYKMNFSGLPQYPKTENNIDIGKTLQQSQDALKEYEAKNQAQMQQIGDNYIKDNNILADDSFSSLHFVDAKSENAAEILTYQQYYKDIPVLGSNLVLSVNPQNNQVTEKQNALSSGINIAVDPVISAKDAAKIAEKEIKDPSYIFSEGKLAIAKQDKDFYLVWKTTFESAEKGDTKEILVGAKHGGIIQDQSSATNQTSDITK